MIPCDTFYGSAGDWVVLQLWDSGDFRPEFSTLVILRYRYVCGNGGHVLICKSYFVPTLDS